jgi:hypothetical protein
MAEDVRQCPWDNSAIRVPLGTTGDGECFAGTGLPVRENRSVVALEGPVDHVQGHVIEDALLLREHVKDPVENEVVIVVFDLVVA